MKTKFLAMTTALAMALAAVAPAAAADRTITVSGEGDATAAPDMATVRVGVAVRADTARGAVDGMSQAMQKVLDAVAAAAIPAKDVQTEGLNLGSVYRPEPQDGSAPPQFEARSSVAVRTSDLKGLGALLDGLVSAGANELQGVTFGLADPAAARDEARRAAVADALARAKLYAEAAGVTLGPVVSLSENGPAPEPMMRMSAAPAAADMGVPIAGGEMSVAAQVTLVLSIGD